ncbi:MAG TPA: serine hydrolase domain-containing protein [Terriglobales bacterium]|jgi:CubicO group peptidase (beta-lactamase class C family)|nr:serine hydrolase domain-containing protein [Terriglobales bacterium]
MPFLPKPLLACFLALGLVAGAGCAAAQPPPAPSAPEPAIPGSIPGKKFAAFLKAFNSGDPEAMRKFIASNYSAAALAQRPPEERAAAYVLIYQGSGGFVLHQIERSEERELVALVQGKSINDWVRITLAVEDDVPYGIPGIQFEYVVPPPAAATRPRPSDQQIAGEMDRYLARLTDAGLFSGTVIIAKDGRPIFQKACGTRQRAPGVPVVMDTPFGLASMGKMFTGVSVAQLAQAGKLSFDDPVSKYLPEAPHKLADKITIHQLLTHTSGLAPFLDGKLFDAHRGARAYSEYLADIFKEPMVAPPGSKFSYSNGDYVVLAAIVEKLTGDSFPAYLQAHVYGPAGMEHSTLGTTTAGDMVRFGEALRGHRLLSAENTERLLAGKVSTGDGGRYAYGFEEARVNGQRICGHGGGGPGISDRFDLYMDSGYTVVVLSDRDPDVGGRVATKARGLLTAP